VFGSLEQRGELVHLGQRDLDYHGITMSIKSRTGAQYKAQTLN